MRTINWYDIEIYPKNLSVGEELHIKGWFRPSQYWPEHIPSVEGRVFLNVGISGPNFIRLSSSIDGISMVQSTSLQLGRDYEFSLRLKARRSGSFHVHPLLNVKDAGPLVGPGKWINVTGVNSDFKNEIETMFGNRLDLESLNLNVIYGWHLIWFVLGAAWIFYWFRKRPLLISRMRAVDKILSEDRDADEIITDKDRKIAVGFITITMLLIMGGFLWAESKYPITTPLRTAKVTVPKKAPTNSSVKVKLNEAFYKIPGRSFEMSLTVENFGKEDVRIGEFSTANIRFVNSAVLSVSPADRHDLVSSNGLRIEGGPIKAASTQNIKVFAEDSLWETQRLTQMINDPDSIIAGLLFFYSDNGKRNIVEVGGPMLPVFE